MVRIKPKELKYTTWQNILIDLPDDCKSISLIYKLNKNASWVSVRGYLDLLAEKGLIKLTENKHKTKVELTDTGKAFRQSLNMMVQVIPVAGENNEIQR